MIKFVGITLGIMLLAITTSIVTRYLLSLIVSAASFVFPHYVANIFVVGLIFSICAIFAGYLAKMIMDEQND